jgi:hypothetical protein
MFQPTFRGISSTNSTRMQVRPALAALANSAPPALAAVANAVYDAVRIRIRDLPITPANLLSAQRTSIPSGNFG